jgi:hypothetical protein
MAIGRNWLLFILVSVGMKFQEGRQVNNSTMAQYWTTHIDQHFQSSMCHDATRIKELKVGLRVGQLLDLPFQLSYNRNHLCSFLSKITSFKQLKLVEHVLPGSAIVVMCVL